MTLLLIVAGVAFPTLKNFFHGRALDSEVRRFLSLTRYAQSRAVSEGIPMVLWLDARGGTYGLQTEAGYLELDARAVEYELDEDLSFDVSQPPVAALISPRNRSVIQAANLPAIRFSPDGSIGETSPEYVRFQETRTGPEGAIWVAQVPHRHGFEIRHDEPLTTSR